MKPIIILDNVFSDDEFELIDQKNLLYQKSTFNDRIDPDRNSIQCNMINPVISSLFLSKVKYILPDVIKINPCLRFIKYEENGFFNLHYDEEIVIDDCISKYTVIFCLNSCTGKTIITDDDFNIHSIDNIKNRLIVFHQDLEHRGFNISSKKIIRTDGLVLNKF